VPSLAAVTVMHASSELTLDAITTVRGQCVSASRAPCTAALS
jgi:hypothetical protein